MECDCGEAAGSFKSMDFMMNGNKKVTMNPKAYLQEVFGPGYCAVAISGIPSSVSGMNMYLLGDTFLRHFYTIFNYANADGASTNSIGLALNSQYVKDGYTKTFAETAGTETGIHTFAQLEDIGDVKRFHKQFNTVQAITIVFTVFLYLGIALQ